MNIRPWVFSIVLGAGCTALRAAPQKIASGHAENLENCLEGFASCDYAQLNPQEKQAVRGAARANNFLDCFHGLDRKSTRLNSSHQNISYAVFCLKKKRSPS